MNDAPTNLALQPGTLERALEIWHAGGPSMYAIGFVALLMCAVGLNVLLTLAFGGLWPRGDRVLARWVASPASARHGGLRGLVRRAATGGSRDAVDTTFDEFATIHIEPVERQLRIMRICSNTAPLLGLFGTVTGMLATFGALASGSGGEQTMGAIAKGISEALITTETGLVVALPGVFFHYALQQRLDATLECLDRARLLCMRHAEAGTADSAAGEGGDHPDDLDDADGEPLLAGEEA
ncbi:MAG: Biopolymer transport protein ExbB [Planctomycetota bacterium]|jgi:biopolymer transport protein ExbB